MAGRTIKYSWLLLVGSLLFSQSMINRLRVPVYFSLNSGIGYDSNYLKLSESEINEVSFYDALLGDSKTVSSLIAKNSLSIKYKPYLFSNHETRLKFKISNNNYLASADKSYISFSFNIAQHLGNYEWLKTSYSFMPEYYLRDYRDRDDIIIESDSDGILTNCHFSQGSTTLSYSKWLMIKRTWLEGKINYKSQYYNSEFTEYDLDIYSYGISIFSNYYKNYSYILSALQSKADNLSYNRGLRSAAQIDRGYNQKYFSISCKRNKLNFILFKELGFKYSIYIRDYNSKEDGDNLHQNRSHRDKKMQIWVGGEINSFIDYTFNVSKRERITNAMVDWVEDLKNFNKYEFMFICSYHFTSNILY